MRYAYWFAASKHGPCFTGEATLEEVEKIAKGSYIFVLIGTENVHGSLPDHDEMFDDEDGLDYENSLVHKLLNFTEDLLTYKRVD